MSLRNQYVNILSDLYVRIASGIYFDKKSHNIDAELRERVEMAPEPGWGAPPNGDVDGINKSSDVRSDFRDTANFLSINTPELTEQVRLLSNFLTMLLHGE